MGLASSTSLNRHHSLYYRPQDNNHFLDFAFNKDYVIRIGDWLDLGRYAKEHPWLSIGMLFLDGFFILHS